MYDYVTSINPPICFVFAEPAAGVAVTLPGKIDNSDETRKPREDEGKVRTRGESDSPRAPLAARSLLTSLLACLLLAWDLRRKKRRKIDGG